MITSDVRKNKFDTGPLSWVMSETRDALSKAKRVLHDIAAESRESQSTSLIHAKTYLHQVHGALQMVDIDGVTVLLTSIEDVLSRMDNGTLTIELEHINSITDALDAIQKYLDNLLVSRVQQPVRLFFYYRQMQVLRGQERTNPVDLFYPDLSINTPIALVIDELTTYPANQTPNEINAVQIRKDFEKILLPFLKQTEPEYLYGCIRQMQALVAKIWLGQHSSQGRSFWAVMHGYLELVADQRLFAEQNVKQLIGRLNLQIRRLAEGVLSNPESLLRDALFFIARGQYLPPNALNVYNAYQLDGQVPVNYESHRFSEIESGALSVSQELLTHIKHIWGKIANGEIGLFGQFEQKMNELADVSIKLKSPPLSKLLNELIELSGQLNQGRPGEAFALEMAVSLLFLENILDQIAHLPADFSERIESSIARLRILVSGKSPDKSDSWLDEISQKVQQRQTMEVVVGEMQSSLHIVEKTLDDYFRSPADGINLAPINLVMHQIAGALAILDQDDANLAVVHTQALIRQMVQADQSADLSLHNKIAQNIGVLSFFIEALKTQPDTVKNKFIYEHQTGDFKFHFLDTAELVQLENETGHVESIALYTDSVQVVTEQKLVEQPLAGQQTQSASLAAEAIDAELLDVFLMETQEVLACINETIPMSRSEPGNQDYLITLRRSFHTLKGSSRMVGLDSLGKVAWNVEQVMNDWLANANPGTKDLYALLEKASEVVGGWVSELIAKGASDYDGQPLIDAAERLKNGEAYFYQEVDLKTDLKTDLNLPGQSEPKSTESELERNKEEPQKSEHEAKIIEFPISAPYFSAFEDNVKKIGDVEIGVSIFTIYLAEIDEIIRFLSQDFSEWRHESYRPVTTHAVHAAHSLAGSSATVGFISLQEIAHALEMVLQQLEHHPVVLLPGEFDTLDRCISCIKEMVQQFSVSEMAPRKPEQILVLEQLLTMLTDRAQLAETNLVAASSSSENDIDSELLNVFLEEGSDLFPLIGQTLRSWQAAPHDIEIAQSLLRLLHTIKGSARMAGAMALGQHTHDIESQIEHFLREKTLPSNALDNLMAQHDAAVALFDQLRNHEGHDDVVVEIPQPEPVAVSQSIANEGADGVANEVANAATSSALIRVRADILDRLVNLAGEVSISHSRLENEITTLRSSLVELNENVTRLRDQLREVEIQAETQISSRMTLLDQPEFDPLESDRFTRLQELTRMMAESVNDVYTVHGSISKTVEDTTDDLRSQARLTHMLQHDLMRVRMVPFSSISERLYRITRQTSKELDKQVNLDIQGLSVEIDRSVLEKMTAPFEHLLRNAIVHGIESREKRQALSKNEIGEISVQIRQEGNEVVINFNDDGHGLDLKRIREKAYHTGLLNAKDKVSDAEVANLIFEPGFSTANEITKLAGRGVGMDVVRSEAAALGGRISVAFTPNVGSRFTIYLPLTLAVTQVVLLKCGNKTYAVPSVLVEQVQQLKPQELATAFKESAIDWQGQRVTLHYLSTILADDKAIPLTQQYNPVVIIRSEDERVALHVDYVIGNREVVVKNIGQQLARMIGIAGATVLGSGEIVLILNPLPLAKKMGHKIERWPRTSFMSQENTDNLSLSAGNHAGDNSELPQCLPKPAIVMVVDDSLTVRKVTQRLLLREGYHVVLAKDGIDALEQLQDITPDVILVDIEMPRMDGFDLTRNVRNDERLKHIPIIMITSRTANKHRSYALELGVNTYFGKPYQDDILLNAIGAYCLNQLVLHHNLH